MIFLFFFRLVAEKSSVYRMKMHNMAERLLFRKGEPPAPFGYLGVSHLGTLHVFCLNLFNSLQYSGNLTYFFNKSKDKNIAPEDERI